MAKPQILNRRTFLRGTGVCMALPMLEAMMPAKAVAAANAAPPARLAIMTVPFGMVVEKFHPKDTGFDYTISETLKPLEPLRKHFTTFSNLDHNVRGGHSAAHTMLSGIKSTERASYRDGNITIDQRAVEQLGHATRFPSLNFWKEGMSFTRTGVRVPSLAKPSDAFSLLFVDQNAKEKEFVRKSLDSSGSILDAVRDDAKGFERKLGTADKKKLEEYFNSVRETEKKLQASKDWLDKPKPKISDPAMKKVGDGARDENLGGNLVEIWFDLMFLALQTDSTRIVSATASNCNWGLEGVKDSYHTLSHHGQREDKLIQLKLVEQYLMTQLGRFVGRLKDTKQADGSPMLDTTQVLFGSGLGSGSRHTCTNLPLILAGGSFKHGQHIDAKTKQPLCNLYTSMLQQMRCPVDRFNTGSGTLTGLDTRA
jgi:hypothetical protein